MNAHEYDTLLATKTFPQEMAQHRSQSLRLLATAGVVFIVATTVGTLMLTNRHSDERGEGHREDRHNVNASLVASVETPTLKASADHSTIEAHVLKLLSAGKQSDAEEYLNQAIKQFPKAIELAYAITNQRTVEADRILANDSAQLQQGQRDLFLFAACIRSRFDISASSDLFRAVAAINPTTVSGQCARYVLQLDSDELHRASFQYINQEFDKLRKLVATNPDDVMVCWMLAVECRAWNLNTEGAKLYKQILDQWKPGPVLVHQTYANLLDNLGRFDESLVERYQAVKMEPAHWSYDGLANTLDHLGRHQEASEVHAKAVQLAPNSGTHWSNWAVSLIAQKKYAEAIDKCQQSLAVDPQNWRAYWQWGQALEAQGKPKEALQRYRQGLQVAPDNPLLRLLALNLQVQLGK